MQDSLSVKISADDAELKRSIANISKMLVSLDSSSDKVTRNMNKRFESIINSVLRAGIGASASSVVGTSGSSLFEKVLTRVFAQAISGMVSGKRAAGGPVNAGSAYVVGENGPETFVPATSGTILPNGSGKGVTVNMVINTPDANSFRASKGQISAEMAMALQRSSRFL